MEHSALQRLPVADPDIETATLARHERPIGPHPMHFVRTDIQGFAKQPRMVGTLSDVDRIMLNISRYNKQRLRFSAHLQALALADGVEMGAAVFADFLTIR
jgi:hypothetical protein